jgi:hypothetical protein
MAADSSDLHVLAALRRDLRLALDVVGLVDEARGLEATSPPAARWLYLAAAELERQRRRVARAAGILAEHETETDALGAIEFGLRRCRGD